MDKYPGHGHVTVTWKDYTIIWGGTCADPSFVYYHLCGEWVWQKTSGDLPANGYFATAVVIEDKMFVVGGHRANTNCVYILDLKAWTWNKVTPNGTAPLRHKQACSSWVYQNKMYCFGGEIDQYEVDLSSYPSYLEVSSGQFNVYTNQLFGYNIITNCWEWPDVKGEIPQPRAFHATIANSDTVFLFGGETESWVQPGLGKSPWVQLNDLHSLDMVSLRWQRVHGSKPDTSTLRVPKEVRGHSLTWISPSKAILFGGWVPSELSMQSFGDCWLLDLDKAKKAQDLSSIWIQMHNINLQDRSFHTAVMEPLSQRLWLMGGIDTTGINCSKNVEKITIKVVPLKVLAMECIVSKIKWDDPMLNAAPKMLKKEIATYRSSFG